MSQFEEFPAAGSATAPAIPTSDAAAPIASACGTGLPDTRWVPAKSAKMMVEVKNE